MQTINKWMIGLLILAPIFLLTVRSWSHEGHNKNPGVLAAPHGGKIKGTAQVFIELVTEGKGIKLYPYTHDMKPVDLKKIKIEGDYQLPKDKKKSNSISWVQGEQYLEFQVDAKGAHRYQLNLKITFDGKTEPLSFNVEPQE